MSSDVRRARFTIDEIVTLTLDFYKRNYIEGLFLSSGIIRDADYTMEQVTEVARRLREDHDFRGYIHLKTIPDAAPDLLARAGRYADRLSINVELPTEAGLARLAPQKDAGGIRRSMARMRLRIDEHRAERRSPAFAPAGQSTQMIVGADAADDAVILRTSATLYAAYALKRVYYSAFSPIPHAAAALPLRAPPLVREHRLYQADWLMRFYGFAAEEITGGRPGGMLDLDIDPKLAWALAHRERFPVDVNRAPLEILLRVPGLGKHTVDRLLAARRYGAVDLAALARMRVPLRKVAPFIVARGHRPAGDALSSPRLRALLAPPPEQADLFGR